MKKIIYIILMFLAFACSKENSLSIEQSEYFIKFFGSSFSDEGFEIKQTSNDGYIIIGTTTNKINTTDIILIKTDKFGNVEWQETYGDSLNEKGSSVVISQDNSYVFTGTYTDKESNKDVIISKIDNNGNLLWKNTIGSISNEEGFGIQETDDGGFIIVGYTDAYNNSNGNPTGEKDIFIVKTNENGDSLWSRSLGGEYYDVGNKIYKKPEGGYIIVGTTVSFAEVGQAENNIIVIETNSSGIQTDKLTFGGNNNDYGNAIQIVDDGYIILGTTNSFGAGESDIYAIKVGKNIHTLIWEEYFGGPKIELGTSIVKTSDNSLIISGATESIGEGEKDSYIIKIDNDGEEIFSKSFGGKGNEISNSIIQTNDLGYIFLGATNFESNSMISITKINKDGELK